MPVPKKKTSKAKRDSRRGHDTLKVATNIQTCPQCAEPMLMHQVCKECGYYKGKEVVEIALD